MIVRIQCPRCHKSHAVDSGRGGIKFLCPACGGEVIVPKILDGEAAEIDPIDPGPPMVEGPPRGSGTPPPRKAQPAPPEAEAPARRPPPRRGRRRSSAGRPKKSVMLYVFAGIGVVAASCCLLTIGLGLLAGNPMSRPVLFDEPDQLASQWKKLGTQRFHDDCIGRIVELECTVMDRVTPREATAVSECRDGRKIVCDCKFARGSLGARVALGKSYRIRGILNAFDGSRAQLLCFAVDGQVR
jgi:hypothetical protein